jgi:hypothetical protein
MPGESLLFPLQPKTKVTNAAIQIQFFIGASSSKDGCRG